jgi:hypothetical protein
MKLKRLTRFVLSLCLSHNTHKLQDVIMILLQVLDEGHLTDSAGRKVDFRVGSAPTFRRERTQTLLCRILLSA